MQNQTENKIVFESGVSTLQANNLILSVLNDGAVYQSRLNAAKVLLAGSIPMRAFKDIVTEEANKQRKLGCTFKPQHITEATKIIEKETIAEVLESYRDNYSGSDILCTARQWFDKINGNSYFSCKVYIPLKDGKSGILVIPLQYGYGEQYRWETKNVLERIGIEVKDYFSNILFEDHGYMQKNQNWTNGIYI